MPAYSYELPELPYEFNALEPVISAEIMELHYTKHHRGYVTKLNAALEKYSEAEAKGDLEDMLALKQAILFNGGGHVNHSIFWTNLAPENDGGGGEPEGPLEVAINKEFGSFKDFVEKFNRKTAPIQGSGWGWLGFCKEKKTVKIATCQNQDPLCTKGLIPLLGVDVWEHAYYLVYKNNRAEYLNNIWKIVNWKNVQIRFEAANK